MRKMSDYEKPVLESLKSGPKSRNELFRDICPKIMSEKKLQKTLNELEDEEKIICRAKRIGDSHKWTSVYALPKHRHMLEVDYSRVTRAIKELRLELCRDPDVEEVAAKIGEDLENIRKILFEHAPELQWRPPTSGEKEEAIKLYKKAREIASLIKFSQEKYISESEASTEVLSCAQFILKNQFASIGQDDMPFIGVVVGPGFPLPSSPKERNKKESLETMEKIKEDLRSRKLSRELQP
jgi:hypothetical protein